MKIILHSYYFLCLFTNQLSTVFALYFQQVEIDSKLIQKVELDWTNASRAYFPLSSRLIVSSSPNPNHNIFVNFNSSSSTHQ